MWNQDPPLRYCHDCFPFFKVGCIHKPTIQFITNTTFSWSSVASINWLDNLSHCRWKNTKSTFPSPKLFFTSRSMYSRYCLFPLRYLFMGDCQTKVRLPIFRGCSSSKVCKIKKEKSLWTWKKSKIMGPSYGYTPQPHKCILVTSERNLSSAKSKFERYGMKVVTGTRYLGGFIGSPTLRSDLAKGESQFLGEGSEDNG